MGRGFDIHWEGIHELQVKFEKNLNLNAVKTVVKKNGSRLQSRAQDNAPVDTGALKRGIGLEIEDGGMTAVSEATEHYAGYVEYGTRKMQAKPYMKPAFDKVKKQFKADLDKLVK